MKTRLLITLCVPFTVFALAGCGPTVWDLQREEETKNAAKVRAYCRQGSLSADAKLCAAAQREQQQLKRRRDALVRQEQLEAQRRRERKERECRQCMASMQSKEAAYQRCLDRKEREMDRKDREYQRCLDRNARRTDRASREYQRCLDRKVGEHRERLRCLERGDSYCPSVYTTCSKPLSLSSLCTAPFAPLFDSCERPQRCIAP